MKKVALILIALAIVFFAGFASGMLHTIMDGKISTDGDYYLLEIDGQLFSHYIEQPEGILIPSNLI